MYNWEQGDEFSTNSIYNCSFRVESSTWRNDESAAAFREMAKMHEHLGTDWKTMGFQSFSLCYIAIKKPECEMKTYKNDYNKLTNRPLYLSSD